MESNCLQTNSFSVSRVTSAHPAGARVSGPTIVLGLATIGFLVQILTATHYGYQGDELYYLECARHLAFGYVDQPPLIAFIACLERHVTGDSLYSVRLLPAVAGGCTIWLAGRLARVLGANAFGQVLAALAVLIAPGFLDRFHVLTMNAFEPILWTGAAYIIVRIIQTGNQKLWLWFGLISGIGLLNKYSMGFFGVAVVIGLLLTRERRAFLQIWIWLGCGLAMLIWVPNLIWNFQHHWPFLELMRNLQASGRDFVRPTQFLNDQVFGMNFLALPLWLAGAWWYFFGGERPGRVYARYRVLGWTWLFLLSFFVVMRGKSYYLFPFYPILFAAGGLAVEGWTSLSRLRSLRGCYVVALVASGVVLAPLTLPVLSVPGFVRYQHALHLIQPEIKRQRNGPFRQKIDALVFGWWKRSSITRRASPIHQIDFSYMQGWNTMVRETAHAYRSLPREVRHRTAILTRNYSEAAAIDFFGPKYGLPHAISGNQTYWLWGPRGFTGESILLLGDNAEYARKICSNFRVVGEVAYPYSLVYEHFEIYWCHPLRWNLQQVWPRFKAWPRSDLFP